VQERGREDERASGPIHGGRLQPVWCAVAGAWWLVRGGWCAVAGAQCAVPVQTQLGANCMLVVAWGSAGRSLAQVSASFAVF